MIPNNFKEKHFTDVMFSKWLYANGWTGDYLPGDKIHKEFTRFFVGKLTLAVVKYKNDHPVNRWIFINPNI